MKTQKPRWLVPLSGAAACILLTLLASWYDLRYNGGRLVCPMEAYSFRPTDIPMLLAVILDTVCVLYLFITALLAQKNRTKETNRTRRLNPRLGLLGFLG